MTRGSYELVGGEAVRTTDMAVLIRDDSGEEHWVPRSVCRDGDSLEVGDTDIEVQRWFAEKEGL